MNPAEHIVVSHEQCNDNLANSNHIQHVCREDNSDVGYHSDHSSDRPAGGGGRGLALSTCTTSTEEGRKAQRSSERRKAITRASKSLDVGQPLETDDMKHYGWANLVCCKLGN